MIAKVSVIIPVYNAEKYIEESLNSILKQTYNNIEIVIIDDHSSDNSYEIALRYQAERLIVKKNIKKGACAARNYGFELCTGEYIQFLDADDILNDQKIEAQMKLVDANKDNILYSCKWIHFQNDIGNSIYKKQLIDESYTIPYLWLRDSWIGDGMGQTSIWLTHRNLIGSSGGWNEDLLINQDGEFFSRIILNSEKIKYCNEAIVYYRKGNEKSISQSNKYSEQKAVSLLNSFMLYKKNVIKQGKLIELKEGLAQNFLTFIYQYYNFYPNLISIAEQEFYSLGYATMWPVGGENFIKYAQLFGFKNSLMLRKLFKSLLD